MKKKRSSVRKSKSRNGLVTIARGVRVKRGVEEKMRSKPGSSSTGRYKTVPKGDFAGSAGGASKYSFPINTLARARNALARAHYAPNPEGIRRAVWRKYPELKAKFMSRHGEKKNEKMSQVRKKKCSHCKK